MADYLAKPGTPIFQPGEPTALGAKFWLPLQAFGSPSPRDLVNGVVGGTTGAPTWSRGVYGPQIGGFSATNYLAVDPPAQFLGNVFPWWIATHYVNSNATGNQTTFSVSNGANDVPNINVRININSGFVGAFLRDDAGASVTPSYAAPCNDGLPHVLMIVGRNASTYEVWHDGLLIGTTTGTTLGTMTAPRMSVGVARRTTVGFPFIGEGIINISAGNTLVPKPFVLAQDWLSGRFSAIRPRAVPVALLAAAGATASVTVSFAGLLTGEFFGAAATTPASTTTPAGIPSAEASGSGTVAAIVATTPAGISTAEALGSGSLAANAATTTAGILTAEALGSGTLASFVGIQLATLGIGTAEALGSGTLAANVTTATLGVLTAACLGSGTIAATAATTSAGILSAEALGLALLAFTIDTSGPLPFGLDSIPDTDLSDIWAQIDAKRARFAP